MSVFFGRSMLVWIADVASFACCIAYCMVAIAFVVIRKKEPMLERPYKVKHYMIVGIIAALLSGIMAILYLIPNSGCTFTGQELTIAIIWGTIGVVFAIVSKKKYKESFGISD